MSRAWRAFMGAVLLVFLVASSRLMPSGLAGAEPLRVATWNIENFWHVPGESLRGPYRGRDTIRHAQDYAALRATIARIDADIWALQEIGSPEAARALFPDRYWQLVFSARYAPPEPSDPSDPNDQRDIYTALAVRRGLAIGKTEQIPLNVEGTDRQATAARLEWQGEELWVASLHLKSGCRSDDPAVSQREECAILAAQIPVLEAWIDARLDGPLVIAGDFNRTLMGETRYQPGADPLWRDLSDGTPAPLLAFPFAPRVNCPEGRFGAQTWPVDFILASPSLAARARSGPYFQAMGGEPLSDHCPVVVEFR